MPQSNRVAVSASLRTHAIWTDSVGYDPYAPEKIANPEEDLLKDKAKELLTLARLTGTLSSHTPGACPKCGQVGHFAYQCRNDVTFSASREHTEAVASALKQKEEEEDEKHLRKALGIGSDDEEPRGAPSLKRRRSYSTGTTNSTSSSSSDSDSESESRKKRKRKTKKHKKDKKKHKNRKEKKSRKKRKNH